MSLRSWMGKVEIIGEAFDVVESMRDHKPHRE